MLNLKRPKVLITKPQEEKNPLKSILEEAGIQVLWIPAIKITPLEKPPFFEELVEDQLLVPVRPRLYWNMDKRPI
jgi:uroporphyrinogen-III synthase